MDLAILGQNYQSRQRAQITDDRLQTLAQSDPSVGDLKKLDKDGREVTKIVYEVSAIQDWEDTAEGGDTLQMKSVEPQDNGSLGGRNYGSFHLAPGGIEANLKVSS